MKIVVMINANWQKTDDKCIDADTLELALYHFFLGAMGNKDYGLSVDVGLNARSKYEREFPVTSKVLADGSSLKSPQDGFALADAAESMLEKFEKECALPLTIIMKEEETENVEAR